MAMQVGVGTSTLQLDMVMDRYQSITNVDYSAVAIERMRDQHKGVRGLRYAVADCRRAAPLLPAARLDKRCLTVAFACLTFAKQSYSSCCSDPALVQAVDRTVERYAASLWLLAPTAALS